MKLLVTGSSGFGGYPVLNKPKYQKNPILATTALAEYEKEYSAVCAMLDAIKPTEIITMGRDGVEEAAAKWALSQKVKTKSLKPNWMTGNRAGYEKLCEAADYADAALILSDMEDKHSKITRVEMRKRQKSVKTISLAELADHSSHPQSVEP